MRQTPHHRALNRLCDELRSALGRVTQSDALTLAIASGGLAVVLPQCASDGPRFIESH